jgi:hypothetical protein
MPPKPSSPADASRHHYWRLDGGSGGRQLALAITFYREGDPHCGQAPIVAQGLAAVGASGGGRTCQPGRAAAHPLSGAAPAASRAAHWAAPALQGAQQLRYAKPCDLDQKLKLAGTSWRYTPASPSGPVDIPLFRLQPFAARRGRALGFIGGRPLGAEGATSLDNECAAAD